MEEIKQENSFPREATNEEIKNLIHEVDDFPGTAWLLVFTGAAMQFARYGVTVIWRKYPKISGTQILTDIRELSSKSTRQSTASWGTGFG
jgi:hypothetical protein